MSNSRVFIGIIIFALTLFLLLLDHKLDNTGLMVDCNWWVVTSPLWVTAELFMIWALIRFINKSYK